MYIKLSANQFFDDQGFPLVAGRVSVYCYGSDTLANIYTLEGGTYVAAQNPVTLTDEGRTASIWFEATKVTVKVEKYNIEDSYELLCTYSDGFDFPAAKNDTIVTGMAGLAVADPALGSVTVVGYDTLSDCGARTFVWDPSCTANADGGAIVASNIEDTGRWILCSDLREMPSSYYGIKPGVDEANVSAFVSYPTSVGQWGIKLPPVPRFMEGTYTTQGSISTTKVVSFDKGAKFTHANIVCKDAEVTASNDYVADFQFTGYGVEAHSAWFRSVDGFWHCDACTMFVDSTNNFANLALTSSATISNATVISDGPIAMTYSNQAYITLNNVNVVGKLFRNGSDYVQLQGNGWGDRMFTGASGDWDPGRIQDGHRVQFNNAPLLVDFESADKWYAVMHERKERLGSLMGDEVDFENRKVSSQIVLGSFKVLKNVDAGSVMVTATSLVTHNVKTTLYVDCPTSCAIQLNGSDIVLADGAVGLSYIGGNGSNITLSGSGIDPTSTALTMNGGHFTGTIRISDANADTYAEANLVSFNNVTFDQQFSWRVNKLAMRGCFGGVKVDLLPYKSGTDYLYHVDLLDNIFAGSTRFWFTCFANDAEPHTELAGHVKFGHVAICGNQFLGSDAHPIKALRWHPYATTSSLFATDVGTWQYEDNIGNCPRVRPLMTVNGSGIWGSAETGPDSYNCYLKLEADYLWCPYFTMANGGIDYMKDAQKQVTMGQWIGGFPALGSSSNYLVLGVLKKGQSQPSDMWDEDLNNMFIVYDGFTIGVGSVSDLTIGRVMWPEY